LTLAPQELENIASRHAAEAKARLTGRKTPSILHYQRAVDALLKLVHLYPDYKLNKIYTLPLHYFYFYMQGEQAVRGLAKSYVVM
jgi:hypothetical protein